MQGGGRHSVLTQIIKQHEEIGITPPEELSALPESEIRALIGKVTNHRDTLRFDLDHQFNHDKLNIQQEDAVERQRILSLISLKKTNLPRGGSIEETMKAVEIKKEINELDIKLREISLATQRKLVDLRYEHSKSKNEIQRQWETDMGILKMYLLKCTAQKSDEN